MIQIDMYFIHFLQPCAPKVATAVHAPLQIHANVNMVGAEWPAILPRVTRPAREMHSVWISIYAIVLGHGKGPIVVSLTFVKH